MNYTMLKGKIHRAVVKQADLNYVGSITVDTKLLEAAGILEYEMVQIVDVENGNRFETYTIAGEPGSGMICLNGAAARPKPASAIPAGARPSDCNNIKTRHSSPASESGFCCAIRCSGWWACPRFAH